MDVIVEGRERPHEARWRATTCCRLAVRQSQMRFSTPKPQRFMCLLSYGERQLEVRVQDNGCGMSEEILKLRRPGHYGIAGMYERAERLGGIISIRSRVGEGTEVNLCVPGQLLYQDDVLRQSGWRRLGSKWRYGRLKDWEFGYLNHVSDRRARSAEIGSQTGNPDQTNS